MSSEKKRKEHRIQERKFVPEVTSDLKVDTILIPPSIYEASGIRFHGRRIKSLIFTTDIAIIMNTNADAVLAVYPFTPHPSIFSSIMSGAPMPVFAGVGGGTTGGYRCSQMGLFAESLGALAVVLNAPTTLDTLKTLRKTVDCPIVFTIVSEYMDIEPRLEAGVDVLNVSGGKDTAKIVKKIRKDYPKIPIIATGGPTEESIYETIEAGANAISYTPPTNGDLFRKKMDKYRNGAKSNYKEHHELL